MARLIRHLPVLAVDRLIRLFLYRTENFSRRRASSPSADHFTFRTLFDFDGDGKANVSVFRPSNGAWYLQQSTNGFTGLTFGFGSDKIVPADYDSDGKTDVAKNKAVKKSQ